MAGGRLRTVVRRIEINQDNVEVNFRVPPKGGLPEPGPINMPGALQHCTDVRRANLRLAQPMPKARQGLGMPQSQSARLPAPCLHPLQFRLQIGFDHRLRGLGRRQLEFPTAYSLLHAWRLHTLHRRRKIAARRHAIPKLVELPPGFIWLSAWKVGIAGGGSGEGAEKRRYWIK